MDPRPFFTMERRGRLEELDRSFDVAYWQRLGPAAIFAAAWDMVRMTLDREGEAGPEPRLQRAAEVSGRLPC